MLVIVVIGAPTRGKTPHTLAPELTSGLPYARNREAKYLFPRGFHQHSDHATRRCCHLLGAITKFASAPSRNNERAAFREGRFRPDSAHTASVHYLGTHLPSSPSKRVSLDDQLTIDGPSRTPCLSSRPELSFLEITSGNHRQIYPYSRFGQG